MVYVGTFTGNSDSRELGDLQLRIEFTTETVFSATPLY